MNYRHSYHAGNFADVFKHVVLIGLIQLLKRKENPLCYLETHAGAGCYDLTSTSAQKTQEYVNGIGKIYPHTKIPILIQDYFNCVRELNVTGELKIYPGSPYFAAQFLRSQDRLVLSELHPDDFVLLKNLFKHNKQVSIHHQNGYLSLKALLPPKEKRGLILIDPPYEKATEFNDILSHLHVALKKFATGTYAIWYPIKTRKSSNDFLQQLKQVVDKPQLVFEICPFETFLPTQLNGCGMVIINPPWQTEEHLQESLEWLNAHI